MKLQRWMWTFFMWSFTVMACVDLLSWIAGAVPQLQPRWDSAFDAVIFAMLCSYLRADPV